MTSDELTMLKLALHEEIESHEQSMLKEKSIETLHMYLFEVVKDQPVAFARMFIEMLFACIFSHTVAACIIIIIACGVSLVIVETKAFWYKCIALLLDQCAKIVRIDWQAKL